MNLEVLRQQARSLVGWAGVTNLTKLRRAGGRHGSVTIPSHTGVIVETKGPGRGAIGCSEFYLAVEGRLPVVAQCFKSF